MKVLLRKRAAPAVGPRLNQWKGARASQFSEQQERARRERLTSRRRRAWRVGQWIVGLALLAGGLTMVTREMGPVLQGWLEIREVEIEGIHHVTKSEVLERLVLKPGMGLHEVSTVFLAERVRAHTWIKEA
ncbi:MAG: FtsQ-type POTRA domain-containing protein, partial [bacterium]